MQRLKEKLIWLVIMVWTGVAQVYWQLSPHIATYHNASLHASVYEMFKGVTLIGPDLLALLVGYFLVH